MSLKNKMFVRAHSGMEPSGRRLTDDDFQRARAASQGATVSGEHRFSRTYSDIGGTTSGTLKVISSARSRIRFQDNKGTWGCLLGLQHWRERHVATGDAGGMYHGFGAEFGVPLFPCPARSGFRNQAVITNTGHLGLRTSRRRIGIQIDPRGEYRGQGCSALYHI